MAINNNPVSELAESIVGTIKEIASSQVNKAAYDKTFTTTIISVNQIFIDEISKDIQSETIKKYGIPKETDEDEETYYCFKIDGAIYCKKSNANFMLYETATVRIPNGNWDRMYLEVGKGAESEPVELPNIIVSVDEPTDGFEEGDYWVRIDEKNTKNIIALYKYELIESEYKWNTLYNVRYYSKGNGIDISNQGQLSVKLGTGLAFDEYGNICLDVEPTINIQYATFTQPVDL